MKRILGLDLGTTSIGFAYIKEGENEKELSSIEKIGVRVNPLTTDEQTNFEKGKPLTTNADRTLKRGARRNLDRYQLRREDLIEILKKASLISDDSILTENGKNTTFETWRLRAKAVNEKIEKHEFARVLLAINKKRGYKSSRKTKNEEDGQAVDGMGIAKLLYEENLTPGQLSFQILQNGKTLLPDFYRSDLQAEFNKVWNFQKQFYSEIFTDEFYKELQGKGQRATSALFWITCKFNIAEIKDLEDSLKTEKTIKFNKRQQKKLQAYKWRSDAISKQLPKEEVAYVLTEINNDLNKSSGYLGAISDRSKKLYFNKETVGQHLYRQLQKNQHTRLKNQVFYRQDYLDEFEIIWETQAKFHSELTKELKEEIRDIVIFYQRKLKSQKGLISFCEFESREIVKNGREKTVGLRVASKSSSMFQEFKIWQILSNLEFRNKTTKEKLSLDLEAKEILFEELNLKGNLSASKIIELLGCESKDWELNYKTIEGNRTNKSLYEAYLKILEIEGYDVKDLLKVKSNKDELELDDLNVPATKIKNMVNKIFDTLEISTEILDFDADLDGKDFEKQASYQLWHLLYSAEDDSKKYSEDDILTYGNDNIGLKKQLCAKFGFKPEHAKILVNVDFQDDYGNLSSKAMRKIYPYIKEHQYSDACEQAGYRHSKYSLSKEELKKRELKPHLELLKKNSLRNPVVEKILNQMVNVVNTLIDNEKKKDPNFKFDEIRIELARELKKNAKERAEMTTNINAAKMRHEKIVKRLQSEFGVANPTRNDIIRYKLYEELKNNGYKDLYTNTYIPREKLFTKEIDIEHIIPQSKAFDDSFSNKTICYREENLKKGNRTAIDYIQSEYGGEKLEEYLNRITALNKNWGKDKQEEGISKAKFQKLQKRESEIGEGFAERDLRDSQYIAKKAKSMLFEITPSVVSTSGSITDRLREDWDLINVMKELNLPKYRMLGLAEIQERKFGKQVEVITDWTKRNDHRHHAMDALAVAFTKRNHIQYLNYLNARKNENHKLHANIIAIEKKETELVENGNGSKKRLFKKPLPNFRQVAKEHLENVLVSHKAKNKVVTKNKNKTKSKKGEKVKIELTPRGQLHKETVYGKYHYYNSKEEKVGTKFNKETIAQVSNPLYRKLLLQRLEENNNDPKKAFGGKNALVKNLIYLDKIKTEVLPEKVKLVWLEEDFSIRKDITPENFKDLKTIEKVLDDGVKRVLKKRLSDFGNDPKKAFSDLGKNPIWLNEEKGISIKRVTISGVKNAEHLHYKKDHLGNFILDDDGHKIPVGYVSTGNNHHIAIYRDENGELLDYVVSFSDAVKRKSYGLPIVPKDTNKLWDKVFQLGIDNQSILATLPRQGLQLEFSMKQNECFVFPNEAMDFNPKEVDLHNPNYKKLISPNLFIVQTISKVMYGNNAVRDYVFRHHLDTTKDKSSALKGVSHQIIKSLSHLHGIVKVRINHLGDIVSVGEY
ncbi:type II CRISPR RNA-guided endonuclease Cas9 [Confluentibacter flavum]|uniref:CRISPR-associated endonuclease Cas9 n=1 Tax=Confluentibacter flavum TaxID=1909700 RepID=A0A2N3HJD8_9FLAO|nr:type II CRISPR RNA-guided endonuclease Cas9 [Confluentibacter flavum]PKQ45100.1 type II CRISPR RNA-guided endonuclease Cas9 [Confluentibacter flavum]